MIQKISIRDRRNGVLKTIGYTVKSDSEEEYRQLIEVGRCHEVINAQDELDNYTSFFHFLRAYKKDHLVVVNVESLGLQLIQIVEICDWLIAENIKLSFIEKKVASDRLYLDILHEMAISEKNIVSRRTLTGLKKAREKGSVSGRPRIDDRIIHKIKYLYISQKKTIREISVECGVSLGTVHKYIKQTTCP